jgi:hypothetical protein
VWKDTGRGRNRFKIRDLFSDERCIQPVLDFLRTTEVGRRTGPNRTEEAVNEDPELEEKGEQSEENEREEGEEEIEGKDSAGKRLSDRGWHLFPLSFP